MQADTSTIAESLANARQSLELNSIPDAALEARILVRAALDLSHAELLTRSASHVDSGAQLRLNEFIARRVRREPVQYITGRIEFYGRDFVVDSRVLITRPETELLVEQALLRILECRIEKPRILDVGTGSGVLAVTMAAELPAADVVATDISTEALDVAQENARALGVSDRIQFHHGSITEGVTGLYDVVLSNPPYVLTRFLADAEVQPELVYEPQVALDGGGDGMDVYRQLLPELGAVMADGGAAYIEIDPPVAEPCLDSAKRLMPTAAVSVLTDLSGLERCMAIELPC